MVVCHFADSIEKHNECKSSEEMRAALEEFNKCDQNIREKCVLLSMDVKALYPSMQWEDIVIAVKEMIEMSGLEIENVNWREVSKYIAVMVPAEVIEKEGLTVVIPKRKKKRTRKITINYLRSKNNDDKWTIGRKPGVRQKQKMLALAISTGVKVVMSNHTYRVGDQSYLQTSGGAIGLELTGAVSRAFIWRWDKRYLEKIRKAGLCMRLYERYVDDSNQVAEIPPANTKYNAQTGKMVKDDNPVPGETDEQRTARTFKEIANHVQDSIVMEEDYPGRNSDGKLPILDMKVWIDEEHFVVFQHFEKPMANRQILQSQSAQSDKCKRSVHVNELVRRILNTSVRICCPRSDRLLCQDEAGWI